jgi:hypothetical protein
VLALIAVVGLIAGGLGVASTPARAAGSLPCGMYASGGTPCVACLLGFLSTLICCTAF